MVNPFLKPNTGVCLACEFLWCPSCFSEIPDYKGKFTQQCRSRRKPNARNLQTNAHLCFCGKFPSVCLAPEEGGRVVNLCVCGFEKGHTAQTQTADLFSECSANAKCSVNFCVFHLHNTQTSLFFVNPRCNCCLLPWYPRRRFTFCVTIMIAKRVKWQ